ncbi:MAG: hypothetical protein C0625_16230 [Arcobacter sp.]|nr:MAG: hypothetical protein C0625_16230 [Arcobacter sp.]
MKKAFSLIEISLVIIILIFVGSFFSLNYKQNNLDKARDRIILYLKQTRYQALIDNTKNNTDNLWHKKRWTLKFFRCNKYVGGLYYSIYSDINKKGHVNLDESLSDPLTNKKIYSSNKCEPTNKTSKYVLLTKVFNIMEIEISCNSTSSLGQISFGNDGKVYSKLSSFENEYDEYEITNKCIIKLINDNSESKKLVIEPKTGYVYKI